jgi:hypothetical protein
MRRFCVLFPFSKKRGPGTVATARLNRPADTLAEPHWWERGVFQKVEDADYGELLLQSPPGKMCRTPPRIKWACRPVGADNEAMYLKYLGLGKSRLRALKADGVLYSSQGLEKGEARKRLRAFGSGYGTLDATIAKSLLGACRKKKTPFLLILPLEGVTKCEVYEEAPFSPAQVAAAVASTTVEARARPAEKWAWLDRKVHEYLYAVIKLN